MRERPDDPSPYDDAPSRRRTDLMALMREVIDDGLAGGLSRGVGASSRQGLARVAGRGLRSRHDHRGAHAHLLRRPGDDAGPSCATCCAGPYVADSNDDAATDSGPATESDWLIFRTGPSELGVHPTSGPGGFSAPRHHSISLMCDDLDTTIGELASRGAEFATDPVSERFGRIVFMRVPGADDIMLYEPHHAIAHQLPGNDPAQPAD